MSDFRIPTLRRYRLRGARDDKYTLQCPVDISQLEHDAEVPVRLRGGTRDNQVFFVKAKSLEPDESRDRRHNMDAQGKLKKEYSRGLQPGTLLWFVSAEAAENTVLVVSLDDGTYDYVNLVDVLCRPDRVARNNANLAVTLVGAAYSDRDGRKNRRGNELVCQKVIEQQLNGPGIQVLELKKSDVDDKYTHAKKDLCIDLLNMRERAVLDAAKSQQTRSEFWVTVSSGQYPSVEDHSQVEGNPFGSNWCVRPDKRSLLARPNPFFSPPQPLGFKARPVPRLQLANHAVNPRFLSPLVSPATAVAASAGAGLVEALASSSSGGTFSVAYYVRDGGRTAGYGGLPSDDFQVVARLWVVPRGDRPVPFWGDPEMDEERCPICGTLIKSDGRCEAIWCDGQNP